MFDRAVPHTPRAVSMVAGAATTLRHDTIPYSLDAAVRLAVLVDKVTAWNPAGQEEGALQCEPRSSSSTRQAHVVTAAGDTGNVVAEYACTADAAM